MHGTAVDAKAQPVRLQGQTGVGGGLAYAPASDLPLRLRFRLVVEREGATAIFRLCAGSDAGLRLVMAAKVAQGRCVGSVLVLLLKRNVVRTSVLKFCTFKKRMFRNVLSVLFYIKD
jgi:hypothetical protein